MIINFGKLWAIFSMRWLIFITRINNPVTQGLIERRRINNPVTQGLIERRRKFIFLTRIYIGVMRKNNAITHKNKTIRHKNITITLKYNTSALYIIYLALIIRIYYRIY